MKRSEYNEQVMIFEWARLYELQYPDLFLLHGSIMGGTGISLAILNKFKKAGMKKGKPDINLPVARGGYIGLWIELKRRGGPNPSDDQETWLRALAGAGHYAVCCKGSDAAISIIKSYLTGKILKEDQDG
jgi:hypothetical protein